MRLHGTCLIPVFMATFAESIEDILVENGLKK